MSALKLEELYKLLALSAAEDERYMKCWKRVQNPELERENINWLSSILLKENMFSHYEKETKQKLFEQTLKIFNQVAFLSNDGKALDINLALFLSLDMAPIFLANKDDLAPKLTSVIVYGGDRLRKSHAEGGVFLFRGLKIFMDYLKYTQFLIYYLEEQRSNSFDNPLRDVSPKVTLENFDELTNKEISHLKKYIKGSKEHLKRLKDKKNLIQQLDKWISTLESQTRLTLNFKNKFHTFLSPLALDLGLAEIKNPQDQIFSKTKLLAHEKSEGLERVIEAFADIPYMGLHREMISSMLTCDYDKEYSIHISLPHYLSNISAENENVLIHETSHMIDTEYDITQSEDSVWEELYEKYNIKGEFVLNTYGLTNKVEFFAVCSECFMQNPEYLKQNMPDVFNKLEEHYHFTPLKRAPLSELIQKSLSKSFYKI